MGVARQYYGQLGKQDNCLVAVSLSLASAQGIQQTKRAIQAACLFSPAVDN